MDNMIIRQAVAGDLKKLAEFEQGLISAERPFDNTLNADPIHYYNFEKLMNNDNTYLVVAEVENQLIACGYARIEKAKPYVNYRFYSYLGFMYVAPEHRGKGVNQKIIDALAHWSKEQGITMMHLDVFSENLAALRAYNKAGFKANLVEMRLDISS
ncbi:MAG: GNAT family N-acetyltransferase [Colwellia sp.]|nr:GNAT family N-acetyltransferase [Colwellia sp.]